MTGPWSGHIKYTEWCYVLICILVLCTVYNIAIALLLQIKTTPDYYQSSPALLPTRIRGCVIFQLRCQSV